MLMYLKLMFFLTKKMIYIMKQKMIFLLVLKQICLIPSLKLMEKTLQMEIKNLDHLEEENQERKKI